MSQEQIEKLERAITADKALAETELQRLDSTRRRVASMEAELARLREQQQGWRKTPSPYAVMHRYERGSESAHVAISLVAHIETEATKKLRGQLDEAVGVLDKAILSATNDRGMRRQGLPEDGDYSLRKLDAALGRFRAIREGSKPA